MKKLSRLKWVALLLFLTGRAFAQGAYPEDDVKVSTTPIGSPFLRHLAQDMGIDLRELVKFEKKGFSRTEIITIALISGQSGKPMKEYGKRRLNDKVKLETFAKEAGLKYPTLYRLSRSIKTDIEKKGDQDLPPPLFEEKPKKVPSPEPEKPKKKKKDPVQEATPT